MKEQAMPNSALVASARLTNAVGLHARPSVKLTQLAKSFASQVELALHHDGPWVDAKSPVKIMRVKAPKGAMLYFRARGSDARAAIASLVTLVDRRFDEDEHETGERAHG
jgi:phosphocarrier protein HPr